MNYLQYLLGSNPHYYAEEYSRLYDLAMFECRLYGLVIPVSPDSGEVLRAMEYVARRDAEAVYQGRAAETQRRSNRSISRTRVEESTGELRGIAEYLKTNNVSLKTHDYTETMCNFQLSQLDNKKNEPSGTTAKVLGYDKIYARI